MREIQENGSEWIRGWACECGRDGGGGGGDGGDGGEENLREVTDRRDYSKKIFVDEALRERDGVRRRETGDVVVRGTWR